MHVAFQQLSRLLPVLRYVVHVFIYMYNCSMLQVSMDTAHFGTDCGNESASRESINERRDVTTCRSSSLNADPSSPPAINMSSLSPASPKQDSQSQHSIEDRSKQQQVRVVEILSTLTSVSTGVWMGLLFVSLSMRTCSKSLIITSF